MAAGRGAVGLPGARLVVPAFQVTAAARAGRLVQVVLEQLAGVAGVGGVAELGDRGLGRGAVGVGGPPRLHVAAVVAAVFGDGVRGPAHHLLGVGPVLRVARVGVAGLQKRWPVGRVAWVDRVVEPADAPRGPVVEVGVEAGVVRPDRVEPVLDPRRVGVADPQSRVVGLVPLLLQDLQPGRDVGGIVQGDRALLGRRAERVAQEHPVGHLRDAVTAVGIGPVDGPGARGRVEVRPVEVGDQRVAGDALQRVAGRLPQVGLLGEDAEQDLRGHAPAPGQGDGWEHALRRPGGEAGLLPVLRPADGERALHGQVGGPLHLPPVRLVHLRARVVARDGAGAAAVHRVRQRACGAGLACAEGPTRQWVDRDVERAPGGRREKPQPHSLRRAGLRRAGLRRAGGPAAAPQVLGRHPGDRQRSGRRDLGVHRRVDPFDPPGQPGVLPERAHQEHAAARAGPDTQRSQAPAPKRPDGRAHQALGRGGGTRAVEEDDPAVAVGVEVQRHPRRAGEAAHRPVPADPDDAGAQRADDPVAVGHGGGELARHGHGRHHRAGGRVHQVQPGLAELDVASLREDGCLADAAARVEVGKAHVHLELADLPARKVHHGREGAPVEQRLAVGELPWRVHHHGPPARAGEARLADPLVGLEARLGQGCGGPPRIPCARLGDQKVEAAGVARGRPRHVRRRPPARRQHLVRSHGRPRPGGGRRGAGGPHPQPRSHQSQRRQRYQGRHQSRSAQPHLWPLSAPAGASVVGRCPSAPPEAPPLAEAPTTAVPLFGLFGTQLPTTRLRSGRRGHSVRGA